MQMHHLLRKNILPCLNERKVIEDTMFTIQASGVGRIFVGEGGIEAPKAPRVEAPKVPRWVGSGTTME